MNEEWRPIPGYEGIYDVSDQGRVRSWKWKREHILAFRYDRNGYPVMSLTRDGKVTGLHVHTLVMRTFVGPLPDGEVTRHLDGNPANNNLTNLRYGTHVENAQDRIAHGRDWERNKTHCPAGHSLDGKRSNGKRYCKTCDHLRSASRRAVDPEGVREAKRNAYRAKKAKTTD